MKILVRNVQDVSKTQPLDNFDEGNSLCQTCSEYKQGHRENHREELREKTKDIMTKTGK